jgi:hypothetical protein
MIKHVVMWRLKNAAAGGTKQENALRLKAQLEDLRGKISEIRYLEVGIDFDQSDTAADVVLYSEFDSKASLDAYQKHPEHVKVAEFVKEIREERRVVDYEV